MKYALQYIEKWEQKGEEENSKNGEELLCVSLGIWDTTPKLADSSHDGWLWTLLIRSLMYYLGSQST